MSGGHAAFFAQIPQDWAALIRVVAVAFPGFNPTDLLEMDLDDLEWWFEQARSLAEDMKKTDV
ncbi:MAG: hypothetical protein CMO06_09580 [Thalassospira sp.]|nr:hypothetical protein [Thalassospira sp.]